MKKKPGTAAIARDRLGHIVMLDRDVAKDRIFFWIGKRMRWLSPQQSEALLRLAEHDKHYLGASWT
jgi:hypothetical protein